MIGRWGTSPHCWRAAIGWSRATHPATRPLHDWGPGTSKSVSDEPSPSGLFCQRKRATFFGRAHPATCTQYGSEV